MIFSHRINIRFTDAANGRIDTVRELQASELLAVSGGGIKERVNLPIYDSVAIPSKRQIDQ
jgi:hypothetical protein